MGRSVSEAPAATAYRIAEECSRVACRKVKEGFDIRQ
jgi:hypothetical protein